MANTNGNIQTLKEATLQPEIVEQQLTPAQRLAGFQQGLTRLQEQFGVVIVPVIKTYNNGKQVADLEMMAK